MKIKQSVMMYFLHIDDGILIVFVSVTEYILFIIMNALRCCIWMLNSFVMKDGSSVCIYCLLMHKSEIKLLLSTVNFLF